MDMKIDGQKVIAQRKVRAWSQQQLADVADLSLRTVQRIEHSSHASYESLKSIAAAFDTTAEDFVGTYDFQPSARRPWLLRSLLAVTIAIVTPALYVTLASAEPVMLQVSVEDDRSQIASVQLLNDAGTDSELRIDNTLKFVFTPVLTENRQVRIKTAIYQYVDGSYHLLSKPVVVTDHKQMATIRFDNSAGQIYQLQLTPFL